MKLLLVTTVVSPHMMPLAKTFEKRLGAASFTFAVTQPDLGWRVDMGWPSLTSDRILRSFASENERLELEKLWDESDVVISSLRDIEHMKRRVAKGKLTLYASERWFRPPYCKMRMLFPKWRSMVNDFKAMSSGSYFHYLPIGPYAAHDLGPLAFPSDHCHAWGYFVDNAISPERKYSDSLQVMFASRLLKLKHPEDVIRGFGILLEKHPDSRLLMIGDGERAKSVAKLVRKHGLEANVELVGSKPMNEVWKAMEKAHVFVQASDEGEGWGAVINEAMTRGCAIVASRQSGAAAAMLEHGKNALLFDAGDWRTLGNNLLELASDRKKLENLAKEAKHHIDTLWSPETAAERFCAVAEALLAGGTLPLYSEGPMSIAQCLRAIH